MRKHTPKHPYEKHSKFAISVLTQVANHVPIEEITVKKHSTEEIHEFLFLCDRSKLINCLGCYKTADLVPHFEFINGLTIEGYQFLNSLHSDSARKTARSARITAVLSFMLSVASILASIFFK